MANVKTSSYYILENTIHNQQNSLPPSPTTHTQFSLHPWGEGHEDHNFSYLLPTKQHFVLICSVVFNKNIFIFYTDNLLTNIVGWERAGTDAVDTLQVGVVVTDSVYTATDHRAVLGSQRTCQI